MRKKWQKPELVLAKLGKLKLNRISGAFDIETKHGAILMLYPNSEDEIVMGVHIDAIEVPKSKRKKGVATRAMAALCRLADKYHFGLEGGPVGFSDDLFRKGFVAWLRGFGFRRDMNASLPTADDRTAFYVRRRPR